MNSEVNTGFSFGEFELDPDRRLLLRQGEAVPLHSKAFDLLLTLVENHNKVLSKNELLDKVWENQFVEENNLTVHVAALRKALGETKDDHRFIVTVPGKGYRFVAELNEPANGELVVESHKFERILVEEEIEEAPGEAKLLADGKPQNRKVIFAFVGLALLIAAGFGSYQYFTAPRTTPISSLAVLPFTNQGSADAEYLSDGLSESVIYSLSKQPNLRVMSRNSAFLYRGREAETKIIGSELDVQAIVTGRVVQRGDDLVVRAELISTADNSVIWGEQFSRKMTDIAALQTDIAKAISQKLQLTLSGSPRTRPVNAEAYQLYLQGLHHLHKRTVENMQKSITLFQQAIERDPTFAQAYAGLAIAHHALESNSAMNASELAENTEKITIATQKALELDDMLAEAHAVLGATKFYQLNFAGAENDYRRAIELDPNFASAHQWYSHFLSLMGRHEEALARVMKARELDPFSRSVNLNVGLRYHAVRRYDEAIAEYKKLVETEPDYALGHLYLGSVYEETGRFEEAIGPVCHAYILMKIETPESCDRINSALRQALKSDGEKGYWRVVRDYNMQWYKQGYIFEYLLAGSYARLGEKDAAFEYLEKSLASRDFQIISLKTDRAFDSLHGDPRFSDLLRRIGFPQ